MTEFASKTAPAGWWMGEISRPEAGSAALKSALTRLARPVFLVQCDGRLAVTQDGTATIGTPVPPQPEALPLLGYAPALHPAGLGDPYFKKRHSLRYAYVAGAMANAISSVKMVEAAARTGMLGFFGAAGLLPAEIEAAIDRLQHSLGDQPFGFNLIHSPADPQLERSVVDLYLRRAVRCISASAYMDLTLPLVHYRVKGIHRNGDGQIVSPNRVIAKVSRIEVARKFFSPPPEKFLRQLVQNQMISAQEAALAVRVPMAQDLTAEADSGGHTDNRPAITLLPTMLALRDEISARHAYETPLCVGLGGGVATPEAVAAAFSMGAAYVLTGSINQACLEAGTSETVRRMLAAASQADVTMAPSADMFEMGVRVQVLKRGTMFALRAAKLYELYTHYDRYESIPAGQRKILERDFFRRSFEQEWEATRQFFSRRDAGQVRRAAENPRHKMALVFRSYLGRSSTWATTGDPARQLDYQIWCGPAMGAFNQWVKGSFLEAPENRTFGTVAMNLLLGAVVIIRANWLRCQGIALAQDTARFSPRRLSEIAALLDEPF